MKKKHKAEIFFTDNDERTVSSFTGATHPTPGNVGVCLSGGGSRALSCGMGQLRALKHLQVNGQSLLGQVKALSTVSGGSWAGVPFLYLDDETSDDDYLNGFVEDQNRLVPEATEGHSIAETLNELPNNNIGQGPSESAFSPPALAITALILNKLFRAPTDRLWQTLVGVHILSDFDLYSPRLVKMKPTSLYSFDKDVLQRDVLADNPGLDDETAHLYMKTVHNRVHRPFMICNFAMFVEVSGHNKQLLVPVQSTPFFTGVVGNPKDARDSDNCLVGGGGVTAFAFNSTLQQRQNNSVEVEQNRQWALVDSVGVSSAFFAQAINTIFGQMRSDRSLVAKYLQEYRGDVDKLITKVFAKAPLQDRLLAEIDKVINKIDALLNLPESLENILDNIDDLIPEYFYWSVVDANPDTSAQTNRFADGGNLENTGIASLLSYEDIDNVIAFVNTSTPMTAGLKGVLDENGDEIPNTRIIVDSQVPPLFGYQPYDDESGYRLYAGSANLKNPVFQFNQVFESSAFPDLLRKLWAESGNAENPRSNQKPAICKQTLRVLHNPWFGVKGRGGPNDAKGLIDIVWYYNNRAREWYDSLNVEVQDMLGNFDDPNSFHRFPHYSTIDSHLTKTEINLLANYTAWAVADPSQAAIFTNLFK